MKLFIRTAATAIIGFVVLCTIIFVSAGTLADWRGWAFVIVFTASTNIIAVYLAIKDPVLLERRVNAGPSAETRPLQRALIVLAFLGCVSLLSVSALDHRFGWTRVPAWLSVLGDVLVALGLMINLIVLRENTFAASTIGMMEHQSVISTGPYAVVRHPLYLGILVMMIGVPLALGSLWGLAFLALNVPILVARVLDEEAMLRQRLDGYLEYASKVRHRLAPGIW
jgi:protein-S-isoprenylcysteine O-methyltransferase Ste14